MKNISKWKEEREILLVLDCHLQIQLLRTLFFTLIAKQKLEEEGNNNNYNSVNKIITTPKLWISSLLNPKGGIYRHQGKGGQGDNPWPKARAWPHPCFGPVFPWPPFPWCL